MRNSSDTPYDDDPLESVVRYAREWVPPDEPPPAVDTQLLARLREVTPPPSSRREPERPRRARSASRLRNRRWTLTAALLLGAAALTVSFLPARFLSVPFFGGGTPPLLFADVSERFAKLETLHARLTSGGRVREVWARRPDKLRLDFGDGRYEISRGKDLWSVDEHENLATKKPSRYYRDAERLGTNVIGWISQQAFSDDDFSGFFSEAPVGRTTRDGRVLEHYHTTIEAATTEEGGDEVEFNAWVDAATHVLDSMKLERVREGRREVVFAFEVLEYDGPIAAEKFIFQRREGMRVEVKEPPPLADEDAGVGSVLSGRLTWAQTGKPVGGARLQFLGGADASGTLTFTQKVETDADGRWRVSGVPEGLVAFSVRSWELKWPAVPTFATNVGSPQRPEVRVDGKRAYGGLNFKVYRPRDYCARVVLEVRDVSGKPVSGLEAQVLRAGGQSTPIRRTQMWTAGGKELTDGRGRLEDSGVWPSEKPVRILLSSLRGDAIDPYVFLSEPFVLESGETYRFPVQIASRRTWGLRVVDPAGQGVPGVYVEADLDLGRLGRYGGVFPASTRDGRRTWVPTQTDGFVEIPGVRPRFLLSFALKCFEGVPKAPEYDEPLASKFVELRVPENPDAEPARVVFDARPTVISGAVQSTTREEIPFVRLMVGGEPGTERGRHVGSCDVKEGRFTVRGVPEGPARVIWGTRDEATGSQGEHEATVNVSPGTATVVQIIDERLEVLEVKAP